MTEVLHKYETVFIIDPTFDEDKTKEVVAKFTNLISQSATLEEVDEWGKRRLAYEINDQKDGYYVLVNFSAKADFPSELDRIFRITDGIMRSLIVKKGE